MGGDCNGLIGQFISGNDVFGGGGKYGVVHGGIISLVIMTSSMETVVGIAFGGGKGWSMCSWWWYGCVVGRIVAAVVCRKVWIIINVGGGRSGSTC